VSNADKVSRFGTVGYVKLPDAVPAEVVSSMRAGTWEALGARGIAERDPSTWARPDGQPWNAVKPTCSGGDAVGPDDSRAVRVLLDELLGPARSSGRDWGKTGHGRSRITVRDLPIAGTPTVLVFARRRWRCREPLCEIRTWSEQMIREPVIEVRTRDFCCAKAHR
jgi:hypothetical protein